MHNVISTYAYYSFLQIFCTLFCRSIIGWQMVTSCVPQDQSNVLISDLDAGLDCILSKFDTWEVLLTPKRNEKPCRGI